MAKQRKNTYRISFVIDGVQRDLFVHTQTEKNSVKLHIKKLISSKRTGTPCLESEEWAAKLPRNSNVKGFLVRWGLLNASNMGKTIGDLQAVFMARDVEANTLKGYTGAFNNLNIFFGAESDVDQYREKRRRGFLELPKN